jgi:hypothetical protein
MAHRLTWIDRLRVERVVWMLDTRLYDIPRESRIAHRREVRQNLLTAGQDIGTTAAVRNIGSSAQLAAAYLAVRVRRPAAALVDRGAAMGRRCSS